MSITKACVLQPVTVLHQVMPKVQLKLYFCILSDDILMKQIAPTKLF